jgi:hypothetical protein
MMYEDEKLLEIQDELQILKSRLDHGDIEIAKERLDEIISDLDDYLDGGGC